MGNLVLKVTQLMSVTFISGDTVTTGGDAGEHCQRTVYCRHSTARVKDAMRLVNLEFLVS